MEIEELDIDAQTNAGVTPLMMAVHSGNIKLVASCLNSNLNPFLKDGLDRTAHDYASTFPDVKGTDMQNVIKQAMN